MAMDNETREIILIEASDMNRYINATISETGIVRIIINVARHLPRKKITTSMTNIAAYSSVSVRLFIESLMKEALEKSCSIRNHVFILLGNE